MNTSEDGKQLAEERWAYVESVIRAEWGMFARALGHDPALVDKHCEIVGFYYKAAVMLGYKHGRKDATGRVDEIGHQLSVSAHAKAIDDVLNEVLKTGCSDENIPGIAEKLEHCTSALRAIYIWASFADGAELVPGDVIRIWASFADGAELVPGDVIRLIDKTLDEVELVEDSRGGLPGSGDPGFGV